MFRLMQERAVGRPAASDLVYLYNFERPEQPLALRLPAGQGTVLRGALDVFAANIARDIPRKLDEEGVRIDSERLKKSHRQPLERAYAELVAFAAARRFGLHRDEGRLVFALLDEDGKAMQEDAVLVLPADERAGLENAEQELRAEIGKYLETVRPVERDMELALAQLRRQAAEPLVAREIGNIRDYGYDMKSLLQSERAKAIRTKIIKEYCFCTHECFTTASIVFSKKQMAKVMAKTLRSV
jgi:hypothetical protein